MRYATWDKEVDWLQRRRSHESLLVEVETSANHEQNYFLQVVALMHKQRPTFSYACGGIDYSNLRAMDGQGAKLPVPSAGTPAPCKRFNGIYLFGSDVTTKRAAKAYDVVFWLNKAPHSDLKTVALHCENGTLAFETFNPSNSGAQSKALSNITPFPESSRNPLRESAKKLFEQLNFASLKETEAYPYFALGELFPDLGLEDAERFNPTPSEETALQAILPGDHFRDTLALAFVRKWLPTPASQEIAATLIEDAGAFDDKLGIIETANALS